MPVTQYPAQGHERWRHISGPRTQRRDFAASMKESASSCVEPRRQSDRSFPRGWRGAATGDVVGSGPGRGPATGLLQRLDRSLAGLRHR
jgi:hypothetical protein